MKESPKVGYQPPQLVALHQDVQPETFVFQGAVCTLGRATECGIVVSRSTVSRLHARIERDGPRYFLVDDRSANGTFVNSRQIHKPHLLRDRDLIGLGAATALLRFVDPDPTERAGSRLRYDERVMAFFIGDERLDLTPAQFRLLLHFYQHNGELCTRESCAVAIWGRDYDPGLDADALDRAVNNLRGRLRQVAPTSDFIQTRRGMGYMLEI